MNLKMKLYIFIRKNINKNQYLSHFSLIFKFKMDGKEMRIHTTENNPQ